MTIKTPKISIIIVNYNGKDYLENCLSSIFKTEYQNFEVIVVDNASTDGSVQQIRQTFPTTKIIFNKKNLGSAGRNSGIVHAQGGFVVLLDSDTIVSPNWLSEFMAAFEKKGYGMYQGKLLFMDQPNKINSAGCMLNIFGFSYARGSGEIDKAQYDKSEKINFTSGACTFLPRSVFEKVGLFDLNFFAYVEDTDFGWRALQQGIKSYYVPSVKVFHKGSSTMKWSKEKFYLLERNRQICLHTIYCKSSFFKLLPFFFIIEIASFLFYLKKGMIIQKMKAYSYIIKNSKYLSERYSSLRKKQTKKDSEVVKDFPDEVWVPSEVFEKSTNEIFNKIIRFLSKCAKSIM